jgi:hypothetical protein
MGQLYQKRIPSDHAFEGSVGIDDGKPLESPFHKKPQGVFDGGVLGNGYHVSFHYFFDL